MQVHSYTHPHERIRYIYIHMNTRKYVDMNIYIYRYTAKFKNIISLAMNTLDEYLNLQLRLWQPSVMLQFSTTQSLSGQSLSRYRCSAKALVQMDAELDDKYQPCYVSMGALQELIRRLR